eukprot:Cvel_9550.t2-p1 / transcript=Cvel_9550.t2 / gene=Cvel_9550 / organism=Chromera_velia_CCMP2878 / gene_product=Egg peptide speract receptor, putative / transcript_product=Egg peptide speract receptor, putative / location=Cvel_scaffold553:45540-46046(+) / protein_length=169 / sequence_SO=supercontig / SO=protein_coding / is_pseudo=false
MGYLYGEVVEEGCVDVDSQYVCGPKSKAISLAAVECSGTEGKLDECASKPATAVEKCDSHENDVAIRCSNAKPGEDPSPGTLRLMGPYGTPSNDGTGRLEVWADGTPLVHPINYFPLTCRSLNPCVPPTHQGLAGRRSVMTTGRLLLPELPANRFGFYPTCSDFRQPLC